MKKIKTSDIVLSMISIIGFFLLFLSFLLTFGKDEKLREKKIFAYFYQLDSNFFPTLIPVFVAVFVGFFAAAIAIYGIFLNNKIEIKFYLRCGIQKSKFLILSLMEFVLITVIVFINYVKSNLFYYEEFLILFNSLFVTVIFYYIAKNIIDFFSIDNFKLLIQENCKKLLSAKTGTRTKSLEELRMINKNLPQKINEVPVALLFSESLLTVFNDNITNYKDIEKILNYLCSLDDEIFDNENNIKNCKFFLLDNLLNLFEKYKSFMRVYCNCIRTEVGDIYTRLFERTKSIYVCCISKRYEKSEIYSILEPLKLFILMLKREESSENFSNDAVNIYCKNIIDLSLVVYGCILKTRNYDFIKCSVQDLLDSKGFFVGQNLISDTINNILVRFMTWIANYIYIGELEQSYIFLVENLFSNVKKIPLYEIFSNYKTVLEDSGSHIIERDSYFYLGLVMLFYFYRKRKMPIFNDSSDNCSGYRQLSKKIDKITKDDFDKFLILDLSEFEKIKKEILDFLENKYIN